MNEAPIEARRAAAEEIKQEIRDLLRLVAEEAGEHPLYKVEYNPNVPTHEQQQAVAEAVQSMQATGNHLALPQGVTATTRYSPRWLRRLSWLLGLSDAERSFVSDIADAALEGRPADAYESLMVFADWLEDNVRTEEGDAIRKMTPRDGDVLTVEVDVRKYVSDVAYRTIAVEGNHALERWLRDTGRKAFLTVVAKGSRLERLSRKEMERLGYTSKERLHSLLDPLFIVIAGEPEGEEVAGCDWTLVHSAKDVAERLKRENAELRAELEKEREAFRAYRTDFD